MVYKLLYQHSIVFYPSLSNKNNKILFRQHQITTALNPKIPNQTNSYEVALGNSGKEKLPLNRKKPPAELGQWTNSHLLYDQLKVKVRSKLIIYCLGQINLFIDHQEEQVSYNFQVSWTNCLGTVCFIKKKVPISRQKCIIVLSAHVFQRSVSQPLCP